MKVIRQNKVIIDALKGIDTTKINLDGREFHFIDEVTQGPGYTKVCISGGLNGRGIWSNYFEVLAKVMFQIELRFPDAFVVSLENDTADDIFYLYIGIPSDKEERTFSGISGRETVPESIVKKVKAGEGVIHQYKGKWRIVSMKTNPPTFWNAEYETREKAESALKAYQANRH